MLDKLKKLLSKLPAWTQWHGLLPHGSAGLLLTILGAFAGAPAWYICAAVLSVALAHELGDGDLTNNVRAPWEGLLDMLMFLPVPLVWLVLS
jgi:hypothetical protein